MRIRRRSVRRLWRRIPELAAGLASGALAGSTVRASLASWVGLAGHADAFRLSRAIFRDRDAGNLGKRLLVQRIGRVGSSAPRADLSRPTPRC